MDLFEMFGQPSGTCSSKFLYRVAEPLDAQGFSFASCMTTFSTTFSSSIPQVERKPLCSARTRPSNYLVSFLIPRSHNRLVRPLQS